MFRLPVSGVAVDLRQFTGAQDLMVLESSASPVSVWIALIRTLASRTGEADLDASALPFQDLQALALEQRRKLFGDEIRSRRRCHVRNCQAQTEVAFRIGEYLDRYRPRVARNVNAVAGEPGWFSLRNSELKFRLVTAGDVAEVGGLPNPEMELRRCTIRPADAAGRDVSRVQTAMEALSPTLSQELEGSCPDCGTLTRYLFDPLEYVLRELRYDAEFLFHDVHLLAARYHWSEERILALPRTRRMQYADLAWNSGGLT